MLPVSPSCRFVGYTLTVPVHALYLPNLKIREGDLTPGLAAAAGSASADGAFVQRSMLSAVKSSVVAYQTAKLQAEVLTRMALSLSKDLEKSIHTPSDAQGGGESHVFYHKYFNTSGGEGVGGKSGSLKVSAKGVTSGYQYKKSMWHPDLPSNISSKSRGKSFIDGRGLNLFDADNLAEVIAASVMRKGTESNVAGKPELAPQVNLVLRDLEDQKGDFHVGFDVVSRYLKNPLADLNHISDVEPKDKTHVKMVMGEADLEKGELSLESNVELKKNKKYNDLDKTHLKGDVVRMLAWSAYLADHDVNGGNFMAVKDNENSEMLRVGRIDFGHAFNDLIACGQWRGGGIPGSNGNRIMDFFYRQTICGILKGQKTKVERHFSKSVWESTEMVEALRSIGNDAGFVSSGLNAAFEQFEVALSLESVGSHPSAHHPRERIKRSVEHLASHVKPGFRLESESPTQWLDEIKTVFHAWFESGRQQMIEFADLLELRVFLNAKKSGVRGEEACSVYWLELYKKVLMNQRLQEQFAGYSTGYQPFAEDWKIVCGQESSKNRQTQSTTASFGSSDQHKRTSILDETVGFIL